MPHRPSLLILIFLAGTRVSSSAPQIQSTGVNTISLTGASVYWVTNQIPVDPYSCYVNYGPTSAYGSKSTTTSYGIVGLTGLQQGTTYHYSVNCSNGSQSTNSSDATFSTLASIPFNAPRTVLDNDLGIFVFSGIANTPLPDVSLYVQPANSASTSPGTGFAAMSPLAVKRYYGLFTFAGPPSQHGYEWIPYTELQAYNTEETNAGRPSLLVTGIYEGSHYPVIFDVDSNDQYNAKQQFLSSDPRVVRFMINEYARKRMEDPVYPDVIVSPYYPFSWISSDEGSFGYNSYAVFPQTAATGTLTAGSTSVTGMSSTTGFAAGQAIFGIGIPSWTTISSVGSGTLTLSAKASISGVQELTTATACPSGCTVPWDSGFPQNSAEYINMLQSMLFQWKQIGPDAPLSVTEGTSDVLNAGLDAWANIYGQFSGVDREGWFGEPPFSYFSYEDFFHGYQHLSWFLANGGSVILREPWGSSYSAANLETGILAYLMVKSGNSYVNVLDENNNPVPQASYQAIYDALGKPLALYCYSNATCGSAWTSGGGSFSSATCNGTSSFQCVYARQFEGGWIFFNASAATQTITLPRGVWFEDNSGSPVTSISIPNFTGHYVTSLLGTFASMPVFDTPTYGRTITAPVTIGLSTPTSGGVIHYTTDGSKPTCFSSSGTSITLSSPGPTTISAITCAIGDMNSWAKTYTYVTTTAQPKIQFLQSTDAASDFFKETWATITLTNPTPNTVAVNFSVTGSADATFSPSSGSVTFRPFETAKSLAIQVGLTNNAIEDQTVSVVLSSPTDATLGTNTTYTYTVQRDNVNSLELFAELRPSDEANLRSDQATTVYNQSGGTYATGIINTSTPEYLRTLWKFDLSSIPPTARILSAKIEGSFEGVTSQRGNIVVSAYRMTKSWTGASATWNDSGGNSSNYAATPTATNDMYCGLPAFRPGSVFLTGCTLDVTSDVQNMVKGTIPNYGWMLMGPETAASTPEYFSWFTNNWKDYTGKEIYGPVTSLVVTYTVPNP